jgi:hypothetical protein
MGMCISDTCGKRNGTREKVKKCGLQKRNNGDDFDCVTWRESRRKDGFLHYEIVVATDCDAESEAVAAIAAAGLLQYKSE